MADRSEPLVGLVMGSDSDWVVMKEASDALEEFGVAHEVDVLSAHRMPKEMLAYGEAAAGRGFVVGTGPRWHAFSPCGAIAAARE
jgi:5-(carboxyamino)imidazole ribonucleotide mutase